MSGQMSDGEVCKLVGIGSENGIQQLFIEVVHPQTLILLLPEAEDIFLKTFFLWKCDEDRLASHLEQNQAMTFGAVAERIQSSMNRRCDFELEFNTRDGGRFRYLDDCELHFSIKHDAGIHPRVREMLEKLLGGDISDQIYDPDFGFYVISPTLEVLAKFDTQWDALENGNEEKYNFWG